MNFDRLAPHYDWMEVLGAGRTMQRARVHWLEALAGCTNVLSVGEGPGRFAAAFAARYPQARLTVVDPSAAMLARARRRVTQAAAEHRNAPLAPIAWTQATLPEWEPPSQSFDAIVTCFFLDLFPPDRLREIVAALAGVSAPRAIWLLTDFLPPPPGFTGVASRALHAAMYAFFRQTTGVPARRLTAPDALLAAQGFALEQRQRFTWPAVHADLWRRTPRVEV